MVKYRITPSVSASGLPLFNLYKDYIVLHPFGCSADSRLIACNEDKHVLERAIEHLQHRAVESIKARD